MHFSYRLLVKKTVSKYSQRQINDAQQQTPVQITEAQRENSHGRATMPHATADCSSGLDHEADRGPRSDHLHVTGSGFIALWPPAYLAKMAKNPCCDHECSRFHGAECASQDDIGNS